MLPVELPEVPDYSPKTYDPEDASSEPEPPLSRVQEWVDVDLDLGDGRGTRRFRRETNTMPNWAGSCWYYLRYLDPANAPRSSTPRTRRTGWAPGPSRSPAPRRARATRVASTSTSAGSSTPCCTCCTPGSGTRCSTTWAT